MDKQYVELVTNELRRCHQRAFLTGVSEEADTTYSLAADLIEELAAEIEQLKAAS